MIKLKQLLSYDKVVIQCHDNPDPDAIGSAYAIYRYLAENNVEAEIVYSGFGAIAKSNLVLLTSLLNIPLRYIERNAEGAAWEDKGRTLLLAVDCQYGTGNVKKLEAKEVAVIDHHIREVDEPALCDIRPYLGSCATLVWSLMVEAGYDFNANLDVGTALYYGLYTDTNSLSEIIHPLDMDLRDKIKYDIGIIKKLKNSNLTIDDLAIAGKTLVNHWLDLDTHSAVFEAEPCDPNILGFTSDLALQVDNIDACVVFCKVSGGIKISVRSCVREVMANELAARLCEGVGSGGGHKEKAGGFISQDGIEKLGILDPQTFLRERFAEYYRGYDLVYSDKLDIDVSTLPRYRKNNTPIGYVRSTDVFPVDTEIIIRTLEGDSHISVAADIYIMVGIKQEIYPIKQAKFDISYRDTGGTYAPDERFLPEERYAPTVKNKIQGDSVSLIPYIRPCVPTGETFIYAKELKKRTKVFTAWNLEGYMFGDVGDFLAIRDDDSGDAYVIEKAIFYDTYTKL